MAVVPYNGHRAKCQACDAYGPLEINPGEAIAKARKAGWVTLKPAGYPVDFCTACWARVQACIDDKDFREGNAMVTG